MEKNRFYNPTFSEFFLLILKYSISGNAKGGRMKEKEFEMSKIICSLIETSLKQAGEKKEKNFIFEKPKNSHCGIHHDSGDLSIFVYRVGKRGVAGKVLHWENRSGYERLPGYYRQEGTGIHSCLHKIHAPSLPYEITANLVHAIPYVIAVTKFLFEKSQNTKLNLNKKKSACVAYFGSDSTIRTYYNEIEKKDLTLNNLLLQKVA